MNKSKTISLTENSFKGRTIDIVENGNLYDTDLIVKFTDGTSIRIVGGDCGGEIYEYDKEGNHIFSFLI